MIIWVFGPSAVGKKTLILNAANTNTASDLRLLFDINKTRPVIPVIVPNKKRKRANDFDGCIVKREMYLSHIYESASLDTTDIVYMVHGQTMDLREGILQRMRSKYPEINQQAAYIKLDRTTYKRRTRRRNLTIPYEKAYEREQEWVAVLNELMDHVYIIKK